MTAYATVTSFELLDFEPIITDEDKDVLKRGVSTAIATDLNDPKLARQLDIRYTETQTYVTPVVDDKEDDDEPYYYKALIAPVDCVKHYVFLYGPPPIPDAPRSEEAENPSPPADDTEEALDTSE